MARPPAVGEEALESHLVHEAGDKVRENPPGVAVHRHGKPRHAGIFLLGNEHGLESDHEAAQDEGEGGDGEHDDDVANRGPEAEVSV